MGTKFETVFYILTQLGHGWDKRCTRRAREGHKRHDIRGTLEWHERGTRGTISEGR